MGSRLVRIRMTTTGRKTGLPREVPLYGYEDGDRLVIVGSWAGGPRDPDWVGNLRADPRASVKRGREVVAMRATEVEGKERERAWAIAVEGFPYYETYQRKTDRRFAVFLLEPVANEGS
jgi:deazaflavin-dependent oxidoreductase (nitroreductase family)